MQAFESRKKTLQNSPKQKHLQGSKNVFHTAPAINRLTAKATQANSSGKQQVSPFAPAGLLETLKTF
jgi:hypothetical protein